MSDITPLVHCPECGEETDYDYTPAMNSKLPYELVCYNCGWFDFQRYADRTGGSSEPITG